MSTRNPDMRPLTPLYTLLLALTLAGCPSPRGGTTPRPRPGDGAQRITLEPIQIVAVKTAGGYKSQAFTPGELFTKGVAQHRRKKCALAIKTYSKLLKYFKKSAYAPATHYNLGLCLQQGAKWAQAATHFEAASRRFTKNQEIDQALGAAGVNYAEARRWAASRRCFKKLLGRRSLNAHQRLEAQVRLGFAWFKSRNFSKANALFSRAVRYWKKESRQQRMSRFYVSMAVYHRAAIYHEMAKSTPIRLPVPTMQQDVETMATWMYKAQRGYWDVVKYRHPFWAIAAVYQVGTLYWEFRKALVGAPVPRFQTVRYFDKTLKRFHLIEAKAQRVEYFSKLRTKTRVLLRHAITVYQKALVTAERIGANNLWVKRTRQALAQVKTRHAKEEADAVDPAADRKGPKPARSPLLPATLKPDKFRPQLIEL